MKRYTALSVPVLSLSLRLGAVLAAATLGACSSSAGSPSSGNTPASASGDDASTSASGGDASTSASGDDASAPSSDGNAPVSAASLQGRWRFCDSSVQANPGDAYYIAYGGVVLELGAEGDVLSGDYQYGDGGTSFDGNYHFLSGSYDPTTRLWTPDLFDESAMDAPDGAPLENDYSGDISLTFDSTGTRFIGTGLGEGGEENWYGGREDGSFTCDPSTTGVGSSCSGTPRDCEDQEPGSCVNGCNLVLGVYPMPNSCDGSPDPCNQLGVQSLCLQAGCQWTP